LAKSRNRRSKKSTPQSAKPIASQNLSKAPNKPVATERPAKRKFRPLAIWKNIWAIFGPAVALIGFGLLLWPSVIIAPSDSLDQSQPLSTQFLIGNNGHVPVYNVHFVCRLGVVKGSTVYTGEMAGPGDLSPVPLLPASGSTTRACSTLSKGAKIPNMSITAYFTWPLIGYHDKHVAFFRVAFVDGKYVFLPDVLPPEDWGALITLNGSLE
jgi:hypothetical protein